MDYIHGIRLVLREVVVDGVAHDIAELLRDPRLAGLLSGEGPVPQPRYALAPTPPS